MTGSEPDRFPPPLKCPLCSGDRPEQWIQKNGFHLFQCPDCRTGFRFPLPSEQELRDLYDASLFASPGRRDYYIDDRLSAEINSAKSLALVRRHWYGKGKLLDCGCGFGHFLAYARDHGGFEVAGCELSGFAVKQASQMYHLTLQEATIRKSRFQEHFDVITLWDVIEHLPDPLESLQYLVEHLSPGGLVFLSTGDRFSPAARFFGRRWSILNPSQHLFYFSPASIDALLARCRLQRIGLYRPGRIYNVRYIGQKLHENISILKPLGYLIRTLSPRNFRIPINLGDIMVVVAKRI